MKRIFSGKYYSESMRQLRMLGLIMLALCVLVTAVGLFVHYMDWQQLKAGNPADYATYSPYKYSGVAGMFPMLTLFMYLGGFLLPFSAFGFLTKRSACDFYHAIPLKRGSVFNTTFIACVSWAAMTILATAASAVLICLITGMVFPYANLLYCLPAYFIGTLLMCAIVTLALTLTGTGFSAFMVTMIILFLPRFLFAVVNTGILEYSDILVVEGMPFLFDASYNLLVGQILGGMFGGYPFVSMTVELMFKNGFVYLYSGVLAVLYIVAGNVVYRYRKSETAGSSAPSRALQHVYRCLVTLPFAVLAAIILVMGAGGNTNVFIVLLFISLIVYFMYELITTKSAKKMLACAPWYLAVAAFSVALLLGVKAGANAEIARRVSADEVKAVSLGNTQNYFYSSYIDYSNYLIGELDFNDPELINMLTDDLLNTVDIATGKSQKYPTLDEARRRELSCRHTVKFTLKNGRTIVRNVYMDTKDNERLYDILLASSEYTEARYSLPDDSLITHISFSGMMSSGAFTNDDMQRIWSVYKDEYSKLTKEELIAMDKGATYGFEVMVEGTINGIDFDGHYALDREHFPNTFAALIQDVNSHTDKDELQKSFEEVKGLVNSGDVDYVSMSFVIFCADNSELDKSSFGMWGDRYTLGDERSRAFKEWFAKFADFMVQHGKLTEADDSNFLSLSLDYSAETDEFGWQTESYGCYVSIDEEYMDEFAELLKDPSKSEFASWDSAQPEAVEIVYGE